MRHSEDAGPGHKRGTRKKFFWKAAFVLSAAALAGVAAGPLMSRVEQPKYNIETSEGPFEIRSYGPMIAAEASVQGERRAAIREGFGLIESYIFGNNLPKAKISMTAPAGQHKQTIAMTAPITEQGDGRSWTVRFIMPKPWTMETLPSPADARVHLKPLPPRRFVAVTFSGFTGDASINQKIGELRQYAAEHGLATAGGPVLAFYNPPWTLPFFRRNEVMLELAQPSTYG